MQDRTVAVQAGCRTGRMQGRTDADQIQDKMNAGSLVEPGPELPGAALFGWSRSGKKRTPASGYSSSFDLRLKKINKNKILNNNVK